MVDYKIVCIFVTDFKRVNIMYRRSNKSSQLNLFSSAQSFLPVKARKIFEDDQKWHNQFRVHITQRIDEDLFRPLFCEDFGAPNTSIRVLVGMMVLKEAQGWSDSQLFEQCLFNILVRSALGLMNIDDPLPVPSTYYLLRKRIVERETCGNENLIEKVFSQITKSQAIDLQVNGKKIRMDSKLMGSNIAWYSRYELIHETLRQACLSCQSQIDPLLSGSDISLLKSIVGESGDKVSYRSNSAEIETKLSRLGSVIHAIISQIDDDSSNPVKTLRRVFSEQYKIEKGKIIVRPRQEISAGSIQSPHDTDCDYRQKDDQKVKGYSINVTETCDTGDTLNLLIDVSVDTAGAADCDFLQPAIAVAQEVVTDKIETVNADGAYHSPENQDYCRENGIDLTLGAIQGRPSRYDFSADEAGNPVVTDLETNMTVPVRKVEPRKEGVGPKWAILNDRNQYRYFSQKDIDTCSLRKQIVTRTSEELNVRNNVEASIFQLGFHYPNAKSRYRGLIKHKMLASLRCLWINLIRIVNFAAGSSPNCAQKSTKRRIYPGFNPQIVKTGRILHRLCRFFTNMEGLISILFWHLKIFTLFNSRWLELAILKK